MRCRDYRVDNIRFILIFSVVFGHLLELHYGSLTALLYRFIYTFHMPAFIFITGYFAGFKPQRITLSLIYPYFLFQTLYQAFYAFVIAGETNVTFSYTTPYWLLWYLLATIFYYMLIPMIQVEKTLTKCGILVCSIVVSLLSGYESSVGYYMSLSRILCFLPFFIAGYYVGHFPKQGMIFEKSRKKILLTVSILFLILAELFILSRPERFNSSVLYGSYGYAAAGHNWKHRAMLMAVGFSWILFMFLTVSPKRIRLISVLGKNTLPIFLFHGFIIKLIGKYSVFCYTEIENLLLSAGIAMGIVLLLGNPAAAWICKWVFTGNWITALVQQWPKNYMKIR